ncbi:MAG: response regulator [Desulfosarcina sp.]|nr:response regulator [Desulfobacterales bacterium]
MKEKYKILIADRNPHVREFLKREVEAEGYQVRLAKTGKEVLKWAYHQEQVDLLILDLNLPDENELRVLEKLQDRIPALPVVVHGFSSDHAENPDIFNKTTVFFVEKKGNSVEHLKQLVYNIFQKSDFR